MSFSITCLPTSRSETYGWPAIPTSIFHYTPTLKPCFAV
jgi:hypothetical protein